MLSQESKEFALDCPCGNVRLVLLGRNKNGSGFECPNCQRLAHVDHATLRVTWYVKEVEEGGSNVLPTSKQRRH